MQNNMNKIERAIQDTIKQIKRMQKERDNILSKLEAYQEQIELLEYIERNESIPNQNPQIK
jgi:pyridoxal biosynthesis lyase PdxS